MQPAAEAGGDQGAPLDAGAAASALRRALRHAWLHQPARRAQRVAAGARAGGCHRAACRGLVQARQPGGRCGLRGDRRRDARGVRGQGQDPLQDRRRLPALPPGRPALLLRRLRGGERDRRPLDGPAPEDRGERRHHRARLRARGARDPQGEEGRQVHRAAGRRGLRPARDGGAHHLRRQAQAGARHRARGAGDAGQGGHGQEGAERRRQA
mmetsp:Transcript_9166/g.21544  ORF Transcript_9166/g.21544 Transcript_9166/m.21544 type:complete len:211 (-) Transcript_9166:741-1373(-)